MFLDVGEERLEPLRGIGAVAPDPLDRFGGGGFQNTLCLA